MMEIRDTIAAIATGLTDSGIGIVRISGSDAVRTGNEIFRSPAGKKYCAVRWIICFITVMRMTNHGIL